MNELTKSRFEVVVTSYGRNKNLNDGINLKNQEKANISLSYQFAAIKKVKNEIAACEQKPLARKRIIVQTPFSHCFKIS